MSIATIYRVSVDIPEKLFQLIGHTSTYDRAVSIATSGSLASGSNRYSDIEEWAEFDTLDAAQNCESKFNEMIKDFQQKLD